MEKIMESIGKFLAGLIILAIGLLCDMTIVIRLFLALIVILLILIKQTLLEVNEKLEPSSKISEENILENKKSQ